MTPDPNLPGIDKLLAYIKANFDSHAAFCAHAGFNKSQFSQMLSGHRPVVNLIVAARLEIATGGCVLMRDFLPEDMQAALDTLAPLRIVSDKA
jgi:hypothetical protein